MVRYRHLFNSFQCYEKGSGYCYAVAGISFCSCVSEPTTKICTKIDPYYQRQKCSTGILVSSKIRVSFMRGFAGEGASNESGVVENGDFRFFHSLIFQTNIQCHNYYTVIYSCLGGFQ